MTFQIRIRTTTQPPKQQTFPISAELRIAEFQTEIQKKLLPSSSSSIEFLRGFPPKPIEFPKDDENLLAQDLFQPNESILVRAVALVAQDATTTKKGKRATASNQKGKAAKNNETLKNIDKPETKKPRRAAALAATSSFKEVIKAQDAMMKQEQKKKVKKKSSAPSPTKKTPPQPKSKMSKMTGYKLNGAVLPGIDAKASSKSAMKSEDDITSILLSSSSVGGKGKVGTVIRSAMKNAVLKSYETSRATSRISAVQSNSYTMTPSTLTSRRLNDTSSYFDITYSKGIQGRGDYTDTQIEIIPKPALAQVLRTVYNDSEAETKEMLRLPTMAQVSPRVFWSLVHHFPMHRDNLIEAMQSLTPDLNYEFLHNRKRMLSEKARENLRQEHGDAEDGDVDVIMDVEDAMKKAHEQDLQGVKEQRDRMASAAMARFERQNDKEEEGWSLASTPCDFDYDELKHCILQGNENDDESISKMIDLLSNQCSIHNWRELANADPDSIQSTLSKHCNVSPESAQSWIEAAQTESIDEIMIEICNDNTEAFIILRDEANTGTPKDLALWDGIEDLLWKEAPGLGGLGVTDGDLRDWCRHAKLVLMQVDWLSLYVTPIS